MLDVMRDQSINEVTVVGVLKEVEVDERETSDGRKYITATARVGVDQEVNGVMTENIIPVRSFAMRKKSDGTDNKAYDNILKLKDFISEAAAEDCAATRVLYSGKTCNLKENIYVNKNGSIVDGVFQVDCNFPNEDRKNSPDKAEFTLTGVVGSIKPEYKDDQETGRLKVKFIVVGYNGKADVIELIAEAGNAANFVEQNWHEQDTVSVTGAINMTYKVEEKKIEQAFGVPLVKRNTVSRNELIITGGSFPMDEEMSYDTSQIKLALGERQERIKDTEDKAKNRGKSKPTPKPSSNISEFGF